MTPHNTASADIVIVGAGPTGLTVAITLLARGPEFLGWIRNLIVGAVSPIIGRPVAR